MERIFQLLRNLGPTRLALLGIVMAGVVGFFVWVFAFMAEPKYELLYGELDMNDSARVVSRLESAKIPFQLRHNGTSVYVPANEVLRMRVTLAEQGLPSGGSIGYEIFDNADALSTTNFKQNVDLVRALEGELTRTIRSIDTVKGARVHLVLPKRELFSRKNHQPSASVLLKMSGANRLSKSQVLAIQHLVASAVPGLNPNSVSIVDGAGTLLGGGFGDDDATVLATAQADERRQRFENDLANTVEQLLAKTVGSGKVRAEVFSDMDFDRINTSEEVYDPDGQVVRSTQAIEESGSNRESSGNLPVGTAGNLPDANFGSPESAGTAANENRTEETVNYEISKKVINHVRETGIINRLSVAVLVDGTYETAGDGSKTYQPRTQQELDLLATLVRGAIGFNAERGDTVEVINMRFADIELPEEEVSELLLGLSKEDLFRIGQYLGIVVLAALILLLVVRPLITQTIAAVPVAAAGVPGNLRVEQHATAALAPPDPRIGDGPRELVPPESEMGGGMAGTHQLENQNANSSMKRVGDIVENSPEEALTVVRGWLHGEQ